MTRRRWSGEHAKQARRAARLSQQQVADAIGVHRSAVSEWENGHVEPQMRYAAALADLFARPLDEFVSHDDDGTPVTAGVGHSPDEAA